MKAFINAGNIYRARLAKGYTQAELAQRAGVSQVVISCLERGKSIPRAQNMKRICAVLGLNLSKIYVIEK